MPGLAERGPRQADFVMVVLASHSSPTRTRLRFSAVKPRRSNRGLAHFAHFGREALRAARRRELGQRIDEDRSRALTGEFGVDVEHVDDVGPLEAGEAGRCAVDHRDQRQRARESLVEGVLVVRSRGPGLALVGVVVIRRQFLDACAEDFDAATGVGRDVGTQGRRLLIA